MLLKRRIRRRLLVVAAVLVFVFVLVVTNAGAFGWSGGNGWPPPFSWFGF